MFLDDQPRCTRYLLVSRSYEDLSLLHRHRIEQAE